MKKLEIIIRPDIEGMDDLGGGKIVHAYVPLAEMFGYSTDLRSKTQGRGTYSMFFEKYKPVPKNVQEHPDRYPHQHDEHQTWFEKHKVRVLHSPQRLGSPREK